MRSKAPLSVIEQLIMLLIFALAAAVCLRAFAWADAASRHSSDCDRALIEAQSAASVIRQTGGDVDAAAALWGGRVRDGCWLIAYDAHWNRTDGEGDMVLKVTPADTRIALLGRAGVSVERKGEWLAGLDVLWQEEAEDAG